MTNNWNHSTDETITIVPEVAISTAYVGATNAAADALEALMPKLYEVLDLVGPLLADHWRVWETGTYVEGVGERFDEVTGWDRLNLLLLDLGALGAIYEDGSGSQPFGGRGVPAWYRDFRTEVLRHDLAKLDAVQALHGELSASQSDRRLSVLAELADVGDEDADAVLRKVLS